MSMPVLDQTLLSEIQRVTLEHHGDGGSSWPTGMWIRDEILDYLNDRQREFLALTGLVWSIATPATVAANAQPNPTDWIATTFLTYRSPTGVYRELPKMDAYELDLIAPNWPGATTTQQPRGFYEIDGDSTTTYLVPAPIAVGATLEWFYNALGTTLSGNGVTFTVPDDFVPTIKYGVLADMFGKVGPVYNGVLQQASEARWQEGLELGQLMAQEGWFAG
jgi:hypothetical protein